MDCLLIVDGYYYRLQAFDSLLLSAREHCGQTTGSVKDLFLAKIVEADIHAVISGDKYLILFTVSKLGLDTDDSTPQLVLDYSKYRGADKSLARPTSRCILFDGENISFDASFVIYINSTNIPPIMITNRIYETQNFLSL